MPDHHNNGGLLPCPLLAVVEAKINRSFKKLHFCIAQIWVLWLDLEYCTRFIRLYGTIFPKTIPVHRIIQKTVKTAEWRSFWRPPVTRLIEYRCSMLIRILRHSHSRLSSCRNSMPPMPLAKIKDSEKTNKKSEYSSIPFLQEHILHPCFYFRIDWRQRINQMDLDTHKTNPSVLPQKKILAEKTYWLLLMIDKTKHKGEICVYPQNNCKLS